MTVPATINATALPSAFSQFVTQPQDDALSGGMRASFAVVSIKGGRFAVQYKGSRTPLTNPDGSPLGALDCIILNANPAISKLYYAKAYVEGDNAAPDCFSLDGLAPDPQSPSPQCDTCAACQWNAWGSKITPAGEKIKACADSRRLAIVPAGDLANETWGGPMLLRVPAASLANLAQYGSALHRQGIPYFAAGTRIMFDINASYPRLAFQFLGLVTDEAMAKKIVELHESDQVKDIVSSVEDFYDEPSPTGEVQGQPGAAAAPPRRGRGRPKAAAAEAAPAQPVQQATVAQAPVAQVPPATLANPPQQDPFMAAINAAMAPAPAPQPVQQAPQPVQQAPQPVQQVFQQGQVAPPPSPQTAPQGFAGFGGAPAAPQYMQQAPQQAQQAPQVAPQPMQGQVFAAPQPQQQQQPQQVPGAVVASPQIDQLLQGVLSGIPGGPSQ